MEMALTLAYVKACRDKVHSITPESELLKQDSRVYNPRKIRKAETQ